MGESTACKSAYSFIWPLSSKWINWEIFFIFYGLLRKLNYKTYDFVKSEKVLENIQNMFDPIVEVDGVVMSKNGTDESDHALK